MFRSYSEKICRTDVKPKPSQPLKNYACDICEESNWLSETDVELHRKETHYQDIRKQMDTNTDRLCAICMKLQESQEALISHIKLRHLFSSPQASRIEREIFICDHCDHIFFNKDMLVVHIMYSHMWTAQERLSKTFTCPKCQKLCNLKSIWFHLQLHEIPSISACDICLTNFGDSEELLKHLDNHEMYLKCEVCDYQTAKEEFFENHLKQHRDCKVYKKRFNEKLVQGAFRRQNYTGLMTRYNIHHALRGLHLPRFFSVCILCRQICTNKLEMRQHILRDHHTLPETKTLWKCVCGENFFNQILLKHHIFKMKGRHRQASENESIQITQCEAGQSTLKTVLLQENASLSQTTGESTSKGTKEEATEEEATEEEARGEEATEEEARGEEGIGVEQMDVVIVDDRNEYEMPLDSVCVINDKELTYVYADMDENQIVVLDTDNDREVLGF